MKKPIRCIVIDDEPIAIRILERHFEVFPGLELLATFYLATEALHYLQETNVDLIFLDIEMPRMNGLEFLSALRHQPAIIFTTAYRNYAVEAYDLDAVDYLVKPISLERLGRAISRYHDRFLSSPVAQPEETGASIINIKTTKEIVRLDTVEILYVESFGDYIIVFHKHGKLVSRERISLMEAQLPVSQFVRIHRRYLVAIAKIESIQGNLLAVADIQLPIGRTYRKGLKDVIGC